MRATGLLYSLLIIALCGIITIGSNGCGQIGAISGGAKDTLPPVLVDAKPEPATTNFTGNKISFSFDEYIDELQDIQANIIVSPYPKQTPEFRTKLKTVSIKLKDSLLPNTTYSINFGSAIKDVNEGNVLKNFTYVFSTGPVIDSMRLSGKVELAETGKTDSTMIVMLYRNAVDSTVEKIKPNYIAFVKGDGSFSFYNLPPGNFNIYALKDGDGGKTYNSKSELFAFLDKPVTSEKDSTSPVTLYAYAEEKDIKQQPQASTTTKPKTAAQKKLKYTLSNGGEGQDLRKDLVLQYTSAIKKFDSSKIILTDTNYVPISGVHYLLDSNKIVLKQAWKEETDYRLIINKTAVTDSTDSTIAKTDTIRFKTKREADYGNVVLRFNNIDLKKHPVIQFVQQGDIKESFAITSQEWRYKLFPPGEYEIRILFDDNNNGRWDPGSYSKKLQPEKVIALPKKISIRESWDNESEINL
ncbi:Ig-like domain-containing domain [Ferruginibacter sp.]